MRLGGLALEQRSHDLHTAPTVRAHLAVGEVERRLTGSSRASHPLQAGAMPRRRLSSSRAGSGPRAAAENCCRTTRRSCRASMTRDPNGRDPSVRDRSATRELSLYAVLFTQSPVVYATALLLIAAWGRPTTAARTGARCARIRHHARRRVVDALRDPDGMGRGARGAADGGTGHLARGCGLGRGDARRNRDEDARERGRQACAVLAVKVGEGADTSSHRSSSASSAARTRVRSWPTPVPFSAEVVGGGVLEAG